jgi:HD-like signal output (HDOD) protein
MLEDIAAGMNHPEIGALIAENWNFPDSLVMAIRYHHDPQSAPQAYRDLAETVYLANMLCEYELGNIAYDQFDESVLLSYGIATKAHLDTLIERFTHGFKKVNQRMN